jgi:hypothetical protein
LREASYVVRVIFRPECVVKIWERAFIESHLTAPHGPTRIAAIRVQQVILRDAVNRTTDD